MSAVNYVACDLVGDHSKAEGKAKFLLYVIARYIGGPDNKYPGYAYPGKKRLRWLVGSGGKETWRGKLNAWLADISQGCEHVVVDNYDCNCGGEGLPIEGLRELYISPGLDPSGQGALYCLSLGEPGKYDGCPHNGKCLHGHEKTYINADDETRWYCSHNHRDECAHGVDSREPCICQSSQGLTTNGGGEPQGTGGVSRGAQGG